LNRQCFRPNDFAICGYTDKHGLADGSLVGDKMAGFAATQFQRPLAAACPAADDLFSLHLPIFPLQLARRHVESSWSARRTWHDMIWTSK
jgi:hypothetical protein